MKIGLGATLDSADPSEVFERAGADLAGGVSREAYIPIAAAAARAPLAADPYFLYAVRSAAQGDRVGAIRRLEEARRRNPRHRPARLLLLEQYVRQDRISEASVEMVAIARLIPQTSELLVGQLARLASDPETRAATRRALRDDATVDLVLERLVRHGTAPDLVLTFAGSRARPQPGAQQPRWQPLLVDALVQRGNVDRGYALWRRFTGIAANQPRGGLYDPQFRGLPGSPPFNWSFSSNETGAVERGRGGTIDVSYFGRVSGELASQLLLLAPGRYRLQFRAEGNASGDGSKLIWRVTCRDAQRPLLELPIRGVNYTPRQVAGEFVVPPSGCGSQWLRLEGQSAEFPTTQSATISSFELRPAGRSW